MQPNFNTSCISFKRKFSRLAYVFGLFGLSAVTILPAGCNKVDEKINEGFDNLINFEGIFASGDGYEIEITETSTDNYDARFTKVGTPRSSSVTTEVGDVFFMNAYHEDENTLKGSVKPEDFGLLVNGRIKLNGNTLTITPNGDNPYTFTRTSGGSNGGGNGGGTGGTQTLLTQIVSGNNGDKKIIRFTLPSGVKTMEIRTTESDPGDWNTADMFVKMGSDPTVTKTPSYSWGADCASVESNREDEVCTFSNPQSGQWSVLLFGYNSSFQTTLVVKITK